MKKLFFSICTVIILCLLTPGAKAQPLKPKKIIPKSDLKEIKRHPNSLLVKFISDDSCSITLNNDAPRDPAREKKLYLMPGVNNLQFESIESGQVIRDRAFNLKKEMLSSGEYVYRIKFKK